MKENKFKYSSDNKRYHTFNYYLKNKYQSKVFKVSLNANFTCPNRDGKVATGGCLFCSQLGSGDFAGNINDTLDRQFNEIKNKMHEKWPKAKYIAYFQAYTNTYDTLANLKSIYDKFIDKDNVVALAIATRPDCLDDEKIAYFDMLSTKIDVWIELGLQTTYDKSAKLFNRGYDYQVFNEVIEKLKKTNVKVCVHLINGLVNETKEMMINNAKIIGKLKVDAIKIHMLHLVSDSSWGKTYQEKPFSLLTREEYVEIVATQLRFLPDKMIIQRLTGDADKDKLVAPSWTLNKTQVLNEIDKYMSSHNYYQGDLYE